MASICKPEFQRNLLDLGHLHVDFWQRLAVLSVRALEGFRRQQRLGLQALSPWQEGTARGLLSLDNTETAAQRYRDLYIEEMRNSEQVAWITYEEIKVWNDSFVDQWEKLAKSASV